MSQTEMSLKLKCHLGRVCFQTGRLGLGKRWAPGSGLQHSWGGEELVADDPWTPPCDTTGREEMGVVDPAGGVPSMLHVGSCSW